MQDFQSQQNFSQAQQYQQIDPNLLFLMQNQMGGVPMTMTNPPPFQYNQSMMTAQNQSYDGSMQSMGMGQNRNQYHPRKNNYTISNDYTGGDLYYLLGYFITEFDNQTLHLPVDDHTIQSKIHRKYPDCQLATMEVGSFIPLLQRLERNFHIVRLHPFSVLNEKRMMVEAINIDEMKTTWNKWNQRKITNQRS